MKTFIITLIASCAICNAAYRPSNIPTLNACDYGASTSLADNTAAIQKALDAAINAPGLSGIGGRRVYLPAGAYTVVGPLKVHQYCTLEGEASKFGTGTRINKSGGGNLIILEAPGSQMIKGISMFSTVSDGATAIRSATNSANTTDLRIEDVSISSFATGIYLTKSFNNELIAVSTSDCTTSVLMGPTVNSTFIIGGYYQGNTDAIRIIGMQCNNITISTTIESSLYGIRSTNDAGGGVTSLNIDNTYFENNNWDVFLSGTGDAIYKANIKECFHNNSQGTNIYLNDVYYPTVVDNMFNASVPAIVTGGITKGLIRSGNVNLGTIVDATAKSFSLSETNIVLKGGDLILGSSTPTVNVIADFQSTTKAFAPPRMTTTQKNAISSPSAGMQVYDTTLNKLCIRVSGGWETITSAP